MIAFLQDTPVMPPLRGAVADSWRALYPFQSHWLTLDRVRCHYVDEGVGRPVVMVHGNPTWSFYFRDLICELRKTCRAIAPDHVGCGLSDKPQDYPYRLRQHVDNLERLLVEELDLRDMVLVLHDWGGAIGCGVAVRHPERVSALVLMNTAAFRAPRCPRRIRLCRVPLLGPVLVRGFNSFARGALVMATARPFSLPRAVRSGYLHPYDSWAHRVATLRFVEDIPLRDGDPSWQALTEIEQGLSRLRDRPVLLAWGEKDFCFTPWFRDRWLERFPQARVRNYPSAGHYVLEDASEELLPEICRFVQEQ